MKNKDSILKVILIAFVICVIVALGGIIISYVVADRMSLYGADIMANRGLYGDSWGGVNALVSALAFAGVIVTLYLQNRDLNLQREEMKLQRKEFEEENETIRYQRFENLFYNMLNLQQRIVEGLRVEYIDVDSYPSFPSRLPNQKYISKEVVGRDVFRYLFEKVSLRTKTRAVNGYRNYLYDMGIVNYDSTTIPSYLDHYFRHLYKIVQFVDSQGFDFNEAYKYVSFLRGTLSRYELVWIYYNTLNPDYYRFKLLIEKYSLLKTIRKDLLTECEESVIICNGLGLKKIDLEEQNIQLDFAYFLTDNPDETDKYMISAFWNEKEKSEGLDYLAKWRNIVLDKTATLS